MAEYTEQAVPGILSGTAPDAGLDPVLNDFPANLFTLAPSDTRIFSHETVTQLCPPNAVSTRHQLLDRRDAGLFSALTVQRRWRSWCYLRSPPAISLI